MDSQVRAFFDRLPAQVDRSRFRGMTAVFQIALTGEQGGDWVVNVTNGTLEVTEGVSDHPDVTISAEPADWLALVEGELTGAAALTTGRVKLTGDVTLAVKLPALFESENSLPESLLPP